MADIKLDGNDAALVYRAATNSFEIEIPNAGDDDIVPDMIVYLMGCLVGSQDKEFVTSIIGKFVTENGIGDADA